MSFKAYEKFYHTGWALAFRMFIQHLKIMLICNFFIGLSGAVIQFGFSRSGVLVVLRRTGQQRNSWHLISVHQISVQSSRSICEAHQQAVSWPDKQ